MRSSVKKGKQSAIDGFAHEHMVVGILMKKYHNVFFSDNPLSPYDLIIVRKLGHKEDIIRAQVKTAKKNVSFTGGTRGGVDRIYKSGVKTYTQSQKTSDVVIGFNPISIDQYELYFVPTILIEKWKTKSKSNNVLSPLKNNFEILERCKDKKFILKKAKEYKLL